MGIDDEDAPDSGEIEALVRSGAYKALARRMRFVVGQKLAEIVKPLAQQETDTARGYIAGVQACLRLPEQLKAEIEERRKQARKR